jgi:Hg(II)-responsive transcriptional regulator
MSSFTIGKLAKSALVGVETIRFYERKGLIKRPDNNSEGYRQYSEDDSKRVSYIRRAQELGYTLREIKELLELGDNHQTTCGDYAARIEGKLSEIEGKITDLNRMKTSLLDILRKCDVSTCAENCNTMNRFEPDSEELDANKQRQKNEQKK